MDEVKAATEPFPFVPAMCIAFKALRSEGCEMSCQSCGFVERFAAGSLVAYLISNLAEPLFHFWHGQLVHLATRLTHSVDDCKIGLQRIQSRNGILESRLLAIQILVGFFTYCVRPRHGCRPCRKSATPTRQIDRSPQGPLQHHRVSVIVPSAYKPTVHKKGSCAP